MFLGKLKRSEEIPITLTIDTTPTGTPQYRILLSDHTEHVAAANLTGSGLNWYKAGQNVGVADAVGSYLVEYTAVVGGVTLYAYDSFEVTINEIDDVKAETALILTDTTSIQADTTAIVEDTGTTLVTQIDGVETKVDTAITDIAAVPTVGEIDTELTSSHGGGSWQSTAGGNGSKAITINIKDGDTNNLEGVNISVHNAADDESPVYASGQTDTNGNSPDFLLDAATYEVRLTKAGAIISETETVVITADATVNLTVVAQTVSNPSDPDVCRLRVYPITLGNADLTSLTINISSTEALTIVNEQFVTNTSDTFTYDASTTPDSYYFDAVRGSSVAIDCKECGILHDDITVPDAAALNLGSGTTIS